MCVPPKGSKVLPAVLVLSLHTRPAAGEPNQLWLSGFLPELACVLPVQGTDSANAAACKTL